MNTVSARISRGTVLCVARRLKAEPTDSPEGTRFRVARVALGMSHDDMAEKADLPRTKIVDLEHGKCLNSLAVTSAVARAVGVHPATLSALLQGEMSPEDFVLVSRKMRPDPNAKNLTATPYLSVLADRLGLPAADLAALASEGDTMLRGLQPNVVKAVLGIVHLLGYPLETAVETAKKTVDERGDVSLEPDEWFAVIRKSLPPRPPSGTFPLELKIKVATAKPRK